MSGYTRYRVSYIGYTPTGFIIMSNKGRLPASGLGGLPYRIKITRDRKSWNFRCDIGRKPDIGQNPDIGVASGQNRQVPHAKPDAVTVLPLPPAEADCPARGPGVGFGPCETRCRRPGIPARARVGDPGDPGCRYPGSPDAGDPGCRRSDVRDRPMSGQARGSASSRAPVPGAAGLPVAAGYPSRSS